VHDMKTRILELDAMSHRSMWERYGQAQSNAVLDNRDYNLGKLKPGVKGFHLIFSDREGEHVYHYPWLYEDFAGDGKGGWDTYIEPILDKLNIRMDRIVRMQFALMTPDSYIRKHTDKGRWVLVTHRLHISVYTHEGIIFHVENPPGNKRNVTYSEGQIFEVNNAMPHSVDNIQSLESRKHGGMGAERVQLILDWAEVDPLSITKLKAGQICNYDRGISCAAPMEHRDNIWRPNVSLGSHRPGSSRFYLGVMGVVVLALLVSARKFSHGGASSGRKDKESKISCSKAFQQRFKNFTHSKALTNPFLGSDQGGDSVLIRRRTAARSSSTSKQW